MIEKNKKPILNPAIFTRSAIAFAFIILFALIILGKITYLQTVEGGKWAKISDSLSVKYINVQPLRGSIYSEDGFLLAASVPEYEIRLDVSKKSTKDSLIWAQNIDTLSVCLSKLFKDKTAQDYKNLLTKARQQQQRYLLLQSKVNFSQLKTLKTFPILNLGRYKGGLIVISKNNRIHPFRMLAERTIGYYTEDKAVGLEGAFNEQISGKTGKRMMQRISGGTWMPVNDDAEIIAVDGSDLVSAININMQDIVQTTLLEQLNTLQAKSGTVILMETATGAVRAIANLHRVQPGVYEETFNSAIGTSTEHGSTFKLASYMVALEDKKLKLTDTVDVSLGYIKHNGKILRDAHRLTGEQVTYKDVFEHSSNVGISKLIVEKYGKNPKAFTDGLEKLGFGKPLGIELQGEAKPYFKRPGDKDWSSISLPWLSIGYETTMSPLQMLTFYNAVANNGTMVAPMFAQEVRQLGEVVHTFPVRVINPKIASERTIAQAQELLAGVVLNGSARAAKSRRVSYAGKTGTAQIADGSKGYQHNLRYQASFCGYFPAKNPKFSMIVVINEPADNIYGGSAAAPVFRDIAEKIYAEQLDIHPSIDYVLNKKNYSAPIAKVGNIQDAIYIYSKLNISYTNHARGAEWGKFKPYRKEADITPMDISDNIVPNVIGMGLADALYLLENKGIQITVQGYGQVVSQSLQAGSRISSNTAISLTLK